MALENGYIKIYRKILKWRWYQQPLTKHLFEHLLIISNIEDSDFEKITVHRGECVSSIRRLSQETGMSERQVRTSLERLKSTQEVTQTAYPKFSVFTIQNYDYYQTATQTSTRSRHAPDTGATRERHHNKKDNKDKKDKNDKKCVCVENEIADFEKIEPPIEQHDTTQTYGKFIKLKPEQYSELVSSYGQAVVSEYIDKIDNYIESSGKKPYANHYSTMKRWLDKDGINKQVLSEHSYDLDKLLNHALNNSPK
jgi:hypothetical protein